MRIAIIRLSALGDIINSTPVLQLIKKSYPDSRIEWICEESFAPIIQNHDDLHAVHTVAIKRAKKSKSPFLLFKIISKLRSLGEFDKIIDLQGLLKSAIVSRVIGKNIYGFAKDSIREPMAAKFYKHHIHISYAQNSIYRTLFLVSKALDIDVDKSALDNKKPSLSYKKEDNVTKNLLGDKKNIVFVIGASWPSKIYPKEKFVQLADLFEANIILVWGDNKEKKDAEYIFANTKNTIISPRLSLPQLVALIDSVDLVIGNDTGPTHIAWAMNKPSIVIFGPTPAEKMMWQGEKNVAIQSSSTVNPLKLNRADMSIKEIPAETIYKKATLL